MFEGIIAQNRSSYKHKFLKTKVRILVLTTNMRSCYCCINKTEQTFGVWDIMIMNPTTYTSIHNRNHSMRKKTHLQLTISLMRKHSLKILTSIVVSIILFTGFALIGTNASSTQLAPAGAGEQTIIVVGGDTLWSIASNYIEEGDIRRTVYSIKKRNNLDSTVLQPGQTLIIP